MSLLQHPLRSLDQMDWYLESRDKELFPGAFLLAAGNLGRHILEQIAFILAFYGRMPPAKYLKNSKQLRPLESVLRALKETDPTAGHTYLELASRRGSRIHKFARLAKSFDKWRRLFNEPSHFTNPTRGRRTTERDVSEFARRLKSVIEEVDAFLIVAAVNEIRSNGFIRAVLGKEPENLPGLEQDVVLTPEMFSYEDGNFTMGHKIRHVVISKSQQVPYRWRKHMVFVQDSGGMTMGVRYVTRNGVPLNLNNLQSVFNEFVQDSEDRRRFVRRMKKFGIQVHVESIEAKR